MVPLMRKDGSGTHGARARKRRKYLQHWYQSTRKVHPMAKRTEYRPHPTLVPKVVTSKDKTIKLALDNGCLLIQIGADYPMPIGAIATLALANLLHIHYDSIVEEARKYQQYPTRGKEFHTNAERP